MDTHARGLEAVYTWTEERLHGALEGVQVADEAAIKTTVLPLLDAAEPSKLAVASHVIATTNNPDLVRSAG